MRMFLLTSMALLLGVGLFAQEQNPVEATPASLKTGKRIYVKYCWICHGKEGKGDGPQAASLSTQPADHTAQTIIGKSDKELFNWIHTGGNDMQAFNNLLSDEEIWYVVNYIRKLQE